MDNLISTMIFRFVGVQILIDLITDAPKEVQSLAAANLANMAKSSVGRNILKKQNFYNTKYKNCGLENYELILKLISQKNEGVRINRFLFSLRKHSKNMSKIKKKFILTYGERIFKKMKLGNYSINQNHPNYI